MRNIILILAFSFSQFILQAQSFSNQALNDLILAEFDFVADSKMLGTKKAFYNHLSDSAVTFGRTIRKGKKNFEGDGDTIAWLNWKPVFTDISSSGDFGYNTGPWEFWNNREDEKPVAFGEFVSVWKIQPDGKWKVEIDIGNYHNFPLRKEAISTSTISLKKTKSGKQQTNTLFEVEKKFTQQLNYSELISKEARFYREDHLPITDASEVSNTIVTHSSKIKYSFIDGMIASSEDLGFVYGIAMESGENSTQYYYLRIWKKEDGKNWKIVLDLLTKQ